MQRQISRRLFVFVFLLILKKSSSRQLVITLYMALGRALLNTVATRHFEIDLFSLQPPPSQLAMVEDRSPKPIYCKGTTATSMLFLLAMDGCERDPAVNLY